MAVNQYIRWPAINSVGSLVINGSVSGAITIQAPAVVTSYTLTLPAAQGGANTFLKNDGTGALSWAAGSGSSGFDSIGTYNTGTASADGLNATGTTLFAQSADATHPGMVSTGTQTFAGNKTFSGTIAASNLSGSNTGDQTITLTGNVTGSGTGSFATTIAAGVVVNSMVNASAAIAVSKLAALTVSRAVVSDGSGFISAATTTATEIGYVNGVTSAIQTQLNAKQASGNYITALTGDGTAAGPGSVAITLATVNGNVGSFGSSTSIPSITVNAKGLVIAASGNVVIAPAGTVTGTTLAANVVVSSLTSVGTISTGTWNGTTIAIANGGTGQTSKAAAFDALSPMTTGGDLIYGGASGTGTRLANGTSGQYLKSAGSTSAPVWTSFVAPTVQRFTSSSGTYTTPTSPAPIYIKVRMVGGGAGGSGSTNLGGAGGNTTFGSWTAGGAAVPGGAGGSGGVGGTNTTSTGNILVNAAGSDGNSGNNLAAAGGGAGGSSPFGGMGSGGASTSNGTAGKTNTGSGGGGGGSPPAAGSNPGGGSGGYLEFTITSSIAATYSYAVGAAGTAGPGTYAGGAGGSGVVIVEEYYQ